MKKQNRTTIIIVVSIVIAFLLCGAFYAYSYLTSPEYALQRMAAEIRQNGISALSPHLDGTIATWFDRAIRLTEHPLIGAVIDLTDSSSIMSAVGDEVESVRWQLKDIRKNASSANATLKMEGQHFSGEIELEMRRKNREWVITDIAFPVFSWT